MPSELGKFVRQKRTEAGIGLREFARRIDRSAPFVNQLETDDDPPPASEDTLLAMAKVLGENADELFGLANRLPKKLSPETAIEVALFRKVKGLSAADQKKYLQLLSKKGPDSGTR